MKKFLLSLGVAAMALAANAQVYVVGAGDGLTWDLPGAEFTASSPNVYTFQVNNLTKFKVSTANTTDWDTYNAAAYATGNAKFTAQGVSAQGGQTLPVEIWGEDQEVPYTGNYTITLDLNNMTMTAYTTTPIPTEAPKVFIRGAMNDWGSPATWMFQYNVTDDMYWIICQGETVINAGVDFKFADANWGSINYSAETTGAQNSTVALTINGETNVPLFYNKGNMNVTQNFSGIIYLKVRSNSDTFAIFIPNVYEYSSTVGVNEIATENGQAVYFNLQGQKVVNPEKGIFVKIENGKAEKVVKN